MSTTSSHAAAMHVHAAVPDTQLGLTGEEVALLRHGQQSVVGAGGGGNGSSSSRAASRASSQGLLMMDSSSLSQLGRHFDRVMHHLQQQLVALTQQAETVILQQYDHAGNVMDNADAEIARYNGIMDQIDELELDFDRIRHIRDMVRDFRRRADELERELERSSSRRDAGHGHGHGHGHRSHGHARPRR